MAYLSDLWITDPNNARLYKINDDEVESVRASDKSPRAICVDLNMIDVWIANTTLNTISQFRNGVMVNDIKVGKTPMGITQDEDGNLYVANYSSNTVSKIVNGVRQLPDVSVGIGPRGICVAPDGTVYVANYISSTVSKIVDGKKTLDIPVGSNPYGICCDKYGAVYTANSGANTVSKIVDSKKTLDITVGKTPQGICSDKYGNVWVSNYVDDTVSKIVNGVRQLPDIVSGDGPFAIATTSDGSVYVANYLSNTVSKIYNDIKVATIPVCNNPCSFGDFTGNQAYILFKSGNADNSGVVSYEDLDTNLKTMLTNLSTPTSMPDSNVTHVHPVYTTVKAALDYLLYDAPQILTFSNNVNILEVGAVLSTLNLNWTLNKTVISQSINNGVGAIAPGTISKQLTGINVTSDTTWALTIIDEVPTTVTKSTSVKFQNKRYWGVSASTDISTSAEVIALGGEFATGYTMTKDLNASGGKYLYFAVPTSFGLDVSRFKIGGLYNSDWVKRTISFTNASGYTSSYDIFRSGNIQTGSSINVAIV